MSDVVAILMLRHAMEGRTVSTAVENGANINWLGDVIVPLALFIVSLSFTFILYAASQRQVRREFEFQRDGRYADEFLLATENLRSFRIMGDDPKDAALAVANLNIAWVRFCEFASGKADPRLLGFLSDKQRYIHGAQLRVAKAFHADQLERQKSGDPAQLLNYRELVRQGYFDPDELFTNAEIFEIDLAITAMRDVIRDWPFPEKRRDVLTRIHEWNVGIWTETPTDTKLAIDFLLLRSDPSRYPWVRWSRWTTVAIRRFIDNYRYGRLTSMRENKKIEREEYRKMVPRVKEWRRAEKLERQERIELRKLYEAANRAYRRDGIVPPWGDSKLPQP